MKVVELTPDIQWESVLQQAQTEDVVLTRQGHAVALLSEFDDEDIYWYARERSPEFLASIQRAREQVANGRTIGHEELKKQLGIQ